MFLNTNRKPKMWYLYSVVCSFVVFCRNVENTAYDHVCPADDLYALSCSNGNWSDPAQMPQWEPLWNQFTRASYFLKEKLHLLLTKVKTEDENFLKVQRFYRTCLLEESNDNDALEIFLGQIFQKENSIKNWFLPHGKLVQYKIQPLIQFTVHIDYMYAEKYALYIEPSPTIYPQTILLNSHRFRTELLLYADWILKSFRIANFYRTTDSISAIIEFEMKLAELQNLPHAETLRLTPEQMAQMPYLPLSRVLGLAIAHDQAVIVKNADYFNNLQDLLRMTDPDVVEDYLIWYTIKALSRDISAQTHYNSFLIDHALLNVKSDVPRPIECVQQVTEYFPDALLEYYHRPAFLPQNIQTIFHAIQMEFIRIIRNAKWLTTLRIKHRLSEKIRRIQLYLGMDFKTTPYGQKDAVLIGRNHLENILHLRQLSFRNDIVMILRQKVRTTVEWPCTPFDSNAYYSILENSIFLPLGVLQRPFYKSEFSPLDRLYNYAKLGTLIGHEVAHALDNYGINTVLGSGADRQKFQHKIQCFNESSSEDYIAENIADTVGLRIAFNAFKRTVVGGAEHLKNWQQWFLINFAENWCEAVNNNSNKSAYILPDDGHDAGTRRVRNALRNNNYLYWFKNCPNINNKCNLW